MASTTNILIIGGSGRVGKQVIVDALSQGHNVVALVRKPDSLEPQANLTLVTGSPTSSSDILRALSVISDSAPTSSRLASKPKVTIISTLGQTRANPSNPWSAPTSPAMFMSQSAQALVDALRNITPTQLPEGTFTNPEVSLNVQISKIIILSMFGAGDSMPYMHWSLRWVMAHSNMRQTIDDHNKIIEIMQDNFGGSAVDAMVKRDGKLPVPFVVVRSVMLQFDQPGKTPAVKEYGHGQSGMGMLLGCDMRSVSSFILERINDNRLDGTMPVISN